MDYALRQFLGDGPYPFPLTKINEVLEVHASTSLVVLAPKVAIDMPRGTHTHSSYEFLIPLTPMPPGQIDNKRMVFEVNKLFPINSMQRHGPAEPGTGCRLLGFQVNKNFVDTISYSIYGRKEAFFDNESQSYDHIRPLLELFIEESKACQAGHQLILETIGTQIMVNLFRTVKNNMPPLPTLRNSREKENVRRAIDYFMEYYNSDYSLEDVAQVANLSPYHFIRVFKVETGKTPYDYLVDIKIEKAKELLKKGNRKLSITQVCFMCGFNNLSHFTAVFKRKTGFTPSEYKNIP